MYEMHPALFLKSGCENVWPDTPAGQACFLVQCVFSISSKQEGFAGWPLFNRSTHHCLSTLLSVPWTLIFFAWPILPLLGSSVTAPIVGLALILDELGEPLGPHQAWFTG
jgi:hypothetical protein